MSADDFVFLDVLSSVPNDIKLYSSQVADYVDRHLERASNALREALSTAPWLPESARPRPLPPPRSLVKSAASASLYARVHDWVSANKIKVTIGLVSIGGVAYILMREKRHRKKRRAKKAGNGARLEVVVVAGSPSEPITRSISLDLERRGFIVYIVCNTIEEEVIVHNESRPDVKPLMIDIIDRESARASIERFIQYLQSPHTPFQGARSHHLIFRSLIIVPSLSYPSAPIATLSPSTFNDLLNTRLLTPILTLQSFLPVLASSSTLHQQAVSATPSKPSVLVLTPSIISSLSPAFHAPESSIVSALSSFTSVLSSELSPMGIPVTHLQLGTFDTSIFSPHNRHLATPQSQRAETLKWDPQTREVYARNFVAVSSRGLGRGSSLRELNDAVFDAMASRRGGIVRVGMGSILYGFIGRWAPSSLVGWMMGVRAIGNDGSRMWFGRGLLTSSDASRATSPGSQASIEAGGLGSSDYISVYGYGEKEEH